MMPILILAAGAASRMRGTDKLLEQINGIALLRRQALMALTVSDDVRVALPPHPHARYDALDTLPVRTIEVADASAGMSASLRAIFETLERDVTHAMLLLADLPDITQQDLERVQAGVAAQPDALIWRGATEDGQGGHPMVIAAPLFAAFRQLVGDEGGQSVVRNAGSQVQLVPLPGNRALCDLDTPEEWAAWRAAQN